jgi:hypothetical protein
MEFWRWSSQICKLEIRLVVVERDIIDTVDTRKLVWYEHRPLLEIKQLNKSGTELLQKTRNVVFAYILYSVVSPSSWSSSQQHISHEFSLNSFPWCIFAQLLSILYRCITVRLSSCHAPPLYRQYLAKFNFYLILRAPMHPKRKKERNMALRI